MPWTPELNLIGATGSTGPTGPTGPTGFLSISGTSYANYVYWNGSAWTVGGPKVNIGQNAGLATSGGTGMIAIGTNAAVSGGGGNIIAIGTDAVGGGGAGGNIIAIGTEAGYISNSGSTVAIGNYSGRISQAPGGVAIGGYAAYTGQKQNALAFGSSAGQENQGAFAMAFGYQSAGWNQGAGSVAIGNRAGVSEVNGGFQAQKSIAINGQGAGTLINLPAVTEGLFIKPIRPLAATAYVLNYDPSSGEISYSTSASDLRLKKNVSNTTLGLEFINKLRPVEFEWKDRIRSSLDSPDGELLPIESEGLRRHQGLIAQEVKAVLDDLSIDSAIYIRINDIPIKAIGATVDPLTNKVTEGIEFDLPNEMNGLHGIKYEELITPTIKAVQDLYALVKQQAEQIADLQKRIRVFENSSK
jgi:hypothetical protein